MIPKTGDDLDTAAIGAATYRLSLPTVFDECDNHALEAVLPIAIGFIDDKRVVSDMRGGDGSLVQLRHEALAVLERLTAHNFGKIETAGGGLRADGSVPQTLEDPETVPKWRAWWQTARQDPAAAIAAGKAVHEHYVAAWKEGGAAALGTMDQGPAQAAGKR